MSPGRSVLPVSTLGQQSPSVLPVGTPGQYSWPVLLVSTPGQYSIRSALDLVSTCYGQNSWSELPVKTPSQNSQSVPPVRSPVRTPGQYSCQVTLMQPASSLMVLVNGYIGTTTKFLILIYRDLIWKDNMVCWVGYSSFIWSNYKQSQMSRLSFSMWPIVDENVMALKL